jgi:hypothetical protein
MTAEERCQLDLTTFAGEDSAGFAAVELRLLRGRERNAARKDWGQVFRLVGFQSAGTSRKPVPTSSGWTVYVLRFTHHQASLPPFHRAVGRPAISPESRVWTLNFLGQG